MANKKNESLSSAQEPTAVSNRNRKRANDSWRNLSPQQYQSRTQGLMKPLDISPEEERIIREGVVAGRTLKEIGDDLGGMPIHNVKYRVRKLREQGTLSAPEGKSYPRTQEHRDQASDLAAKRWDVMTDKERGAAKDAIRAAQTRRTRENRAAAAKKGHEAKGRPRRK